MGPMAHCKFPDGLFERYKTGFLPRPTRTIVLACALMAGVSVAGCSRNTEQQAAGKSEADHSTGSPTGLPTRLPDLLATARSVDRTQLILELAIDDATPRRFTSQSGDVWEATLVATRNATHLLAVRWYERYEGVELLLASKQLSFTAGDSAVQLDLTSEYTSEGGIFDYDADGFSNLEERNLNSDPLTDDGSVLPPMIDVEEPPLVNITGGCYVMGSPDTEPKRNFWEAQHEVCVEDFAIGLHEVTYAEYDLFTNNTGRSLAYTLWERGNRPVVNIDWYDATAYTRWLSRQTGKTYRLPTEAEWEYAARAGTTTPFSTGDTIDNNQASFDGRSPYREEDFAGVEPQQTEPVMSFPPNPWGLFDMHGNAAEWTCSPRNLEFNGDELTCDDPSSSLSKHVRGGGWTDPPESLRSAYRASQPPQLGVYDVGFRLVRE